MEAWDCVLAGFPCQPHSMASRKGTGRRPLTALPSQTVRRVGPDSVFLENVSA